MRKLTISWAFLIAGINQVIAQQYEPLLGNPSWYVNVSGWFMDNNFWVIAEKDTVIPPYTYTKFIDSAGYPIAFVREDAPAKKVYRYKNNADQLLYDFSLQYLDSIILSNGKKYIVDQVSFVNTVNGGQRRTLQLKHYSGGTVITGEFWTESVGNSGYPLKPFFELASDPVYSSKCIYQNGVNIFNNGAPGSCPFSPPVAVNQTWAVKNFSISPNPFSAQTNLQLQKPLKEGCMIIYNSQGERLRQVNHLSGESLTISRGNLPEGIYFISLSEGNKIVATDKLIITDN